MQDFDAIIEKRIKAFVAELQGLVRQVALAAVNDALGGRPVAKAPARRKAAEPKATRAPKAKGGRRTSEEIEKFAEGLRQYIEANPGQRIEQIAAAMKLPTKVFARPVVKLLVAGKITKRGTRRATTYYPPKAAGAKSPAKSPAKSAKPKRVAKKKAPAKKK